MKKYRPCIISLFDILGFKDLVTKSICSEIYNLLETFRYFSLPHDNLSERVQESREISIFNFSDTVIRILPIDNKSNLVYPDGIVFHELIDLIHIQSELINKGVLIRGAVTAGYAFYEKDLFYGKGIIDAYLLENGIAKNPRIIVHKELIEAIKKIPLLKAKHHDAKDEEEKVRKLLKEDKDGWLFVDYLKIMQEETECVYDYKVFLAKHREIINKGLLSKNDKTRKKYRWLKKYHNNLVKQFNKRDRGLLSMKRKDLIVY